MGNPNSTGNPYADLLTGVLNSYAETSFNRVNDISYDTYEAFVQDSWKVSRRLTLELGLRFTHFTPWKDDLGTVFRSSSGTNATPRSRLAAFPLGQDITSRDSALPMTFSAAASRCCVETGAAIITTPANLLPG